MSSMSRSDSEESSDLLIQRIIRFDELDEVEDLPRG